MLAGQNVPFGVKKEAGTKASFSRRRGLFIRDHTAEKGIHVFGRRNVFGDDGDDSLLYLFDDRHEKIEGMQAAAAHRVPYTCIVGPLFTLQSTLPLQQIGMYHPMAGQGVRDAHFPWSNCSDIFVSLFLIDIIKN